MRPSAGAQQLLRPIIPPWCEALLPTLPAAAAAAATVRSAKYLGSARTGEQLPAPRWPEVAVLGRSNVGKSSLCNYLLGPAAAADSSGSGLAKVSSQPGRTSSINQYLVNNSWCLTDCPGYGYARTSKTARADWHSMTQHYLKQRSRAGLLVDVLLLVDASLPPREMDLAGAQWLISRRYPVTLVFTKCDKEAKKKGKEQPSSSPAHNMVSFSQQLDQAGLLQPAQFPTCAVGSSSSSRFGRQELLHYLARRLAGHKATAAAAQHPADAPAAAVAG